jgi:hypothetical protein
MKLDPRRVFRGLDTCVGVVPLARGIYMVFGMGAPKIFESQLKLSIIEFQVLQIIPPRDPGRL